MRLIIKNKLAIANVLSVLMHNPQLALDDRYALTPDDFPERFHKIIFGAIQHIVRSGARVLDEVVIDDYLASYPTQHKVFEDNRGIEYLQHAMDLNEDDNFDYFHGLLKKCSLLNQLESQGFDIRKFHNPDAMHIDVSQGSQSNLDQYSLADIIDHYDLQLANLKNAFCSDNDVMECHISKGMRELKDELSESPAWGLPMNSAKMTTICRGRRKKKLYLRSAPTGTGKSRQSLADACRLAVSQYYDPEKKRWVKTKLSESVLFITTELEREEIQTMLWAYVACVPEDHIIDNKYQGREEERVRKAIEIIEEAHFYFVCISDFTIEDIESIIKRHKLSYQIDYVFFDYIHTTSKFLAELSNKARSFKLREDQALYLFADRLKALANHYDIHIDTSTQVNDEWKTMKNPDQSVIRGAKSIADKVDVGYVCLELTEKDKEAIQKIMPAQGMAFSQHPNVVYHVFKLRRGKYNHVKLFMYFDYGTLRTTDMFVTDRDYALLDVQSTNIELLLEQTDTTEDVANLASKEGPAFKW